MTRGLGSMLGSTRTSRQSLTPTLTETAATVVAESWFFVAPAWTGRAPITMRASRSGRRRRRPLGRFRPWSGAASLCRWTP